MSWAFWLWPARRGSAELPSVFAGPLGGARAEPPSVRCAILASLTRAFSLSPSGLRSNARPACSDPGFPSLISERRACSDPGSPSLES
jgi:hypothetical protein